MQQENKPNNKTLQSMGRPARNQPEEKRQNQTPQDINESETAPPQTAQGGRQPVTDIPKRK